MPNELDVNEPRPRIVVKLAEAANPQATALLWSRIEKNYPGTEIERTFLETPLPPSPDGVLSDPGEPALPPADLTRYYTFKMNPALHLPHAIADLSQYAELAEVMEEERPSPAPQVAAPVVPAAPAAVAAGLLAQPHLGPAPAGIGAAAANARPGGRGQGMAFADMESGWNLDHVDLLDLNVQAPVFGVNCDDREHGTAVLGVVAARGTTPGGVIGIAPELAAVKVVSPLRSCFGRREMAQAIRHMAQALGPGDVLLLEAQISFSGVPDIPAEVVPFLADAIRFAVSRGIVVVEPVGNKRVSLDRLEVERGRTLNPRDPRFQDSGAILVAAATADVPHRRHRDSSFGSRVDCYGWGERVVTCGGRIGNRLTDHTNDFSGTSAAAAMVAGVALCVQGMAKAKHGKPFSPQKLRNLLRDPDNGTLPEGGLEAGIGVMPDLEKLIGKI